MRYFTNTLKEQNLGALEPEIYRDWALECMKDILQILEQECLGHEPSNYTGHGGVAYAMYHLNNCIRRQGKELPEDIKQLLHHFAEKSLEYAELSFHALEGKSHEWSIFFGQAGAAVVSALCWQTLYNINNHNVDLSSKVVARVQRFIEISKSAQDVKECKEDEMLYGRAGYILGWTFLEASLDPRFSSYLKSNTNHLVSVARTILDQGYKNARDLKHPEKCPLWWEWHSSAYLGAAHGSMGILFALMHVPEICIDENYIKDLKGTLEYILSLECDSNGISLLSGHFPTRMNEPKPREPLVQWCHGAPGAILLFIKAYHVYGDVQYLQAALRAGEAVWEKGLLTKGAGLCHGISGNAYAFLALYRTTCDPLWLNRASSFCQFVSSETFKLLSRTPDHPVSLFEGSCGMVCVLGDISAAFQTTAREEKRVTFPLISL
eukprot:jgi/Picsp_1/1119/NSC_04601-R1_lanc-like protein 2-like